MADRETAYSCSCSVIHDDVVKSVVDQMPEERVFFDAATFFKVMGDKTRFKIPLVLQQAKLSPVQIP